ncbi:hypothetical protein PRIPAC_80803 [Pristionchus pacificus]|uniref:Uncharacterized protein n=1 Tax=Pristionchus pacificus TaxID=54126 RepID=A0A2A6CLR5_PRIPA|nr:hypothetical protein PRIPAC_80803 [Pristionchus pacificus]|eukprot:PDM79040.1 hypothetical protein PRIPAC_31619 [Pristionchus pacificus]
MATRLCIRRLLRKNRAILTRLGTGQKCQLSETWRLGVLKGANNDGHIHFGRYSPVGFRRRHVDNINLTILPLVYFLPLIDRSLPPEGGERAGGIERAQRQGRGHGGETRVDQKIGSQQGRDGQIYLQARAEKIAKTRFRPDGV